jgi:hypothetical protein
MIHRLDNAPVSMVGATLAERLVAVASKAKVVSQVLIQTEHCEVPRLHLSDFATYTFKPYIGATAVFLR